jgi:hypothetical protein
MMTIPHQSTSTPPGGHKISDIPLGSAIEITHSTNEEFRHGLDEPASESKIGSDFKPTPDLKPGLDTRPGLDSKQGLDVLGSDVRPELDRPGRPESHPGLDERPRFDSNIRPVSHPGVDERPRFDSNIRPESHPGVDERPRFDSNIRPESHPGVDERPRFDSNIRPESRPGVDERPRFDSNIRPEFESDFDKAKFDTNQSPEFDHPSSSDKTDLERPGFSAGSVLHSNLGSDVDNPSTDVKPDLNPGPDAQSNADSRPDTGLDSPPVHVAYNIVPKLEPGATDDENEAKDQQEETKSDESPDKSSGFDTSMEKYGPDTSMEKFSGSGDSGIDRLDRHSDSDPMDFAHYRRDSSPDMMGAHSDVNSVASSSLCRSPKLGDKSYPHWSPEGIPPGRLEQQAALMAMEQRGERKEIFFCHLCSYSGRRPFFYYFQFSYDVILAGWICPSTSRSIRQSSPLAKKWGNRRPAIPLFKPRSIKCETKSGNWRSCLISSYPPSAG